MCREYRHPRLRQKVIDQVMRTTQSSLHKFSNLINSPSMIKKSSLHQLNQCDVCMWASHMQALCRHTGIMNERTRNLLGVGMAFNTCNLTRTWVTCTHHVQYRWCLLVTMPHKHRAAHAKLNTAHTAHTNTVVQLILTPSNPY